MPFQLFFEHRTEQRDGMQRLAQVMAGGRQEAGLVLADALREGHLKAQLLGQGFLLEAGDQRLGQQAVLLQGELERRAHEHRATGGQKQVDRGAGPGQRHGQPGEHGDDVIEQGFA